MKNLGQSLIIRVLIGTLVMLTGSAAARAEDMVNSIPAHASTLQSPDDMLAKVFPFIKTIQNSFIVGGDYRVHLSKTEMRIDHMTTGTSAPIDKRTCMVGLTYMSPVAFFGTRVDIPLMASNDLFDKSAWGTASPGDYVLRFSQHPEVDHPALMLTISARLF